MKWIQLKLKNMLSNLKLNNLIQFIISQQTNFLLNRKWFLLSRMKQNKLFFLFLKFWGFQNDRECLRKISGNFGNFVFSLQNEIVFILSLKKKWKNYFCDFKLKIFILEDLKINFKIFSFWKIFSKTSFFWSFYF